MNHYNNLITKHRNEFSNFPIVFAFSNEQFKEAMVELGLNEEDTDKVYSVPGGGIIKKIDSEAFHNLLNSHNRELEAAIQSDSTGMGFIYDMFVFEPNNHEYSYTRDTESALQVLGLTIERIYSDSTLLLGFTKACENCL